MNATLTMTYRRSSPNWIVLLVVVLASLGAIVICKEHANKHRLADTVRNCPTNSVGVILRNPVTKRVVICPEFESGQFGRMVIETTTERPEEVTAFADSQAKKNLLQRVLANLKRAGYNEVLAVRPDLETLVRSVFVQP